MNVMKKLLFALIIILIVIAGVYKIGMQYGSEVVIDKIANQVLSKDEIDQLIEDPKVQKTIEEQLGAGALQNLRKEQSNNGTVPDAVPNAPDASNLPQTGTNSQLVFATPEEALKFLLTKFSMSELNGFIKMADGGVTTAEKNQIKSALMSRLTPEEYQALKVLGLIELQKRQNSMNSN
ncbi:hypothetical protein [Pelotomaculum schinkii]|nr:hypothetical protein [Pelotomaculum schinkii]